MDKKLYVFWGSVPKNFDLKKWEGVHFFESELFWPEVTQTLRESNIEVNGGLPIHPDEIEKKLLDFGEKLYVHHAFPACIYTYSDVVIELIRLVSLKAFLKDCYSVVFPFPKEIRFVVPDALDPDFYDNVDMDQYTTLTNRPKGFCDKVSNIIDEISDYSQKLKEKIGTE